MFKNRLAELLDKAKKNGKSAAKIAEELGFKRSQFSDWKVGRNIPSTENLQKQTISMLQPIIFLKPMRNSMTIIKILETITL